MTTEKKTKNRRSAFERALQIDLATLRRKFALANEKSRILEAECESLKFRILRMQANWPSPSAELREEFRRIGAECDASSNRAMSYYEREIEQIEAVKTVGMLMEGGVK